jgi:integrase
MPQFVVEAIRERKAKQAEERLLAGSCWNDFHLIFTTKIGTPVEPRRADSEFKRILKKAELPETIRLHDSRHFAASLVAAHGVQPRTAMAILGQSDISVTMNVYSHVDPAVLRNAADKIEAALTNKETPVQSPLAVNLAVKLGNAAEEIANNP